MKIPSIISSLFTHSPSELPLLDIPQSKINSVASSKFGVFGVVFGRNLMIAVAVSLIALEGVVASENLQELSEKIGRYCFRSCLSPYLGEDFYWTHVHGKDRFHGFPAYFQCKRECDMVFQSWCLGQNPDEILKICNSSMSYQNPHLLHGNQAPSHDLIECKMDGLNYCTGIHI